MRIGSPHISTVIQKTWITGVHNAVSNYTSDSDEDEMYGGATDSGEDTEDELRK